MPNPLEPRELLELVQRQKLAAVTALLHELRPHVRELGRGTLWSCRGWMPGPAGPTEDWTLQASHLPPVQAVLETGVMIRAGAGLRIVEWTDLGFESVLDLHARLRAAVGQPLARPALAEAA